MRTRLPESESITKNETKQERRKRNRKIGLRIEKFCVTKMNNAPIKTSIANSVSQNLAKSL